MLSFIPLAISIALGILALVGIFSIFPQLISGFSCPLIAGDTDGDYVLDDGETWTGDPAADAWAQSCMNTKLQTAIVPGIITLAVIVSAILIVTRLFNA